MVDKDKTEVRWQSEWFGKFTLADVICLTSKFTVGQFLAREDFSKRYITGQPIAITELLYPVLQAYDSVAIQSDVEFGGTDQKFNCLVGRELQQMMGQRPQQVFLVPLLVGTDGSRKMSKSLDNYVGISEPPNDIYGKVMSIPDNLMIRYFELVTDVSLDEIDKIKVDLESNGVHPRDVKKRLAREIVKLYHRQSAAIMAEEEFEKVFKDKLYPEEIKKIILKKDDLKEGKIWLIKLIILSGIVDSKSEARRLIEQGGVRINGEKISDSHLDLTVEEGMILKIGRLNFIKLFIK